MSYKGGKLVEGDTFSAILGMSKLMNTGLEPEALAICVQLIEAGVNPSVLAAIISQMRREISNFKNLSSGEERNDNNK